MFLGINILRVLVRAHFNPRLTAWAKLKWFWVGPRNIFKPANINSILLILYLMWNFKTCCLRFTALPNCWTRTDIVSVQTVTGTLNVSIWGNENENINENKKNRHAERTASLHFLLDENSIMAKADHPKRR